MNHAVHGISRATLIACLGALLGSGVGRAACEPRVERIETAAVATKDAAPARSELRTVSVDPPAGSAVGKDTILTIDLEFRIADFSGGPFRLAPLFLTGPGTSAGFSVDGRDPSLVLESAEGRARMCVPLSNFYAEDSGLVDWPLELRFTILKMDGQGTGRGVASSKTIKLNAVDVPADAVERRAAKPPEISDALTASFRYFERRNARYKACLKRFPELQPRLTPAYRAWEVRHKNDIDLVAQLELEERTLQSRGRVDVAMTILDRGSLAELERHVAMSEEALKASCDSILEESRPADDLTETMIGDYLAVLRKWRRTK